ncbi:MAG: GAF domain-containing protein [Cyclobacteriaceae bacterium]|nr:GAF domain-containing protein [Cyclobacteriaceae bacterium]
MNSRFTVGLVQRWLALTIFILMLTNSAWTLYFLYFERNPKAATENEYQVSQFNSMAEPTRVSDGSAPFFKEKNRDAKATNKDIVKGRGDGQPERVKAAQQNDKRGRFSWKVLLPAINIALAIFLIYLFHLNKYIYSLYYKVAEALSKGIKLQSDELTDNLSEKDEFVKILAQIDNYHQKISQSIDQIGSGQYVQTDKSLHANDHIHLSLFELQNKLQELSASENVRNWVNEGIASFATILRDALNAGDSMADQVLSKLVNYLKANQGGFYITEEDNQGGMQLRRISTYAWSKKRFADKVLGLKDNLCGMAVLEQSHIYLKNVPEDFIEITSGLGEAQPKEIIIVPLIFNEKVYGVIEIASFDEFAEYQIDFLLKISENIASALASIEHNKQTRLLLDESRVLTRNLQAQEEELRQNAEELQASQENLERRLNEARFEMQEQIVKIKAEKEKNTAILEGCEDGVVIFDDNGKIEFFNSSAESIWNAGRDEVIGRNIKNLLPLEIIASGKNRFVEYVSNGSHIPLGTRTEVTIWDKHAEEVAVLLTLSRAESDGNHTFALFVQQISVELF